MISRTDIEDMTDAQDEARAEALREAVAICKRVRAEECENDDQAIGALECALAIQDAINAPAPARPSQAGDRQRVQAMCDANWKPAVTYWRERAEKAEAASQAGDERVAEAMEACRIIDAAVKEGHDSVSDLLMHLLEAAVPARAALAAMDTPKGGGDE